MNESPMPTGFVPRTTTISILDDVLNQLSTQVTDVACELFPNQPDSYQLSHPIGAYLLNYQGGRFGSPIDTHAVMQDRQLNIVFNVLARQLHGRDGAIGLCDRLRDGLLGYQPVGCDRKIWALSEQFLGEDYGIWMYQVTLATQTVSMQKV